MALTLKYLALVKQLAWQTLFTIDSSLLSCHHPRATTTKKFKLNFPHFIAKLNIHIVTFASQT
jgi:hypothetical protein